MDTLTTDPVVQGNQVYLRFAPASSSEAVQNAVTCDGCPGEASALARVIMPGVPCHQWFLDFSRAVFISKVEQMKEIAR